MTMRQAAVMFVCVGALLLASGCDPEKKTDGGKKDGKITVAVIPKADVFTFWPTVKKGAEAAGKALDVKIVWQGAEKETNYTQQNRIIEAMISDDEVKGIVLAPQSATAQAPYVKKAVAAGKPVVIIDSGIGQGAEKVITSFVATDNYQGGVMGAKRLAEKIGKKGKVALIRNIPGSASTEAREKGFLETIATFPDIKVAAEEYGEGDPTKANKKVTTILTAHADLAGIFTANEPGAIGALNAVKAANLVGKVTIVGFDASPTLIAGIRAGSLDSTIVQDPFTMGRRGVEILIDKLNGKETAKEEKTPIKLVTKDNLDTQEVKDHLAAYGIDDKPEK